MLAKDPAGYYKALGIRPGADGDAVRLAYSRIKREYFEKRRTIDIALVEKAHRTLTDKEDKHLYDRGELAGTAFLPTVKEWMRAPWGLGVVAATAVLALGLSFGPKLRATMTSFEPGDRLISRAGASVLGEVLAYDEAYRFPNGTVAPAYRILAADGERWFPATDLKRHYTTD